MTNPAVPVISTDAARAWSDPVCTEYAVDELTQAGAGGIDEAGIFS